MLDTNIVSYLLKGQHPAVKSRFDALEAGSAVVSTITEAEVQYGIARKGGAFRLRLAADVFFSASTVVPWDSEAARAYGDLRAEQERMGKPLSVEDLMIAAHALALNLVLVTNDHAFSFVHGLRTEDWTDAS